MGRRMGLSIKDPVPPMLAADIGALCARVSAAIA
jgi:hypothetical protein